MVSKEGGTAARDFSVVIPARFESQRLPKKLLCEVAGKPALWWTLQVAFASGGRRVLVACDSEEIASLARSSGAEACLTDPQLASGTDRCLAACEQLGFSEDEIVVNLQGDELAMPAENLAAAADCLNKSDADIATLVQPLEAGEAQLPQRVKVVTAADGTALYFSRAAIPWDAVHNRPAAGLKHHLGIYAYRLRTLRRFASLPPSRLEQIERLEQLRALENGLCIVTAEAPQRAEPGLDTAADLQRLDMILRDHPAYKLAQGLAQEPAQAPASSSSAETG